MDLVYKNERSLFVVMLVLSLVVWAGLVAGMGGAVVGYAVMFFLFYCFAQSALISYLKGNAVRITADQFPDLDAQINACCAKLGLDRGLSGCAVSILFSIQPATEHAVIGLDEVDSPGRRNL